MLEINAQSFMNAVMELKRIQAVIDHGGSDEDRNSPIASEIRGTIRNNVDELRSSVAQLYARAALIAVDRLGEQIDRNDQFRWGDLRTAMADIESRLRDELGLVRLFVLDAIQSYHLSPGSELLGKQVSDRFPSVLFEMEEAAKCLVLSRPTASAFHCMRALEVAIRALAKFLDIEDPTRPAERNWAFVLGRIKEKIDEIYPAKHRMTGSEGAHVESLYATLDAVKNPWRNATMHTENVYQPFEANHILQAVNQFLLRLSELCDETGQRPDEVADPP